MVCLILRLLLEVLLHSFARVHVHAELDELLVACELLFIQLVQDFFFPLFLEDEHDSSNDLRLLGGSRHLLIALDCHVSCLTYRLNIELSKNISNLV